MEIFICIILSITIPALGQLHEKAKVNDGSNTHKGTKNPIITDSSKPISTHVNYKHVYTNETKPRGLFTSSEEYDIPNNDNDNNNDNNNNDDNDNNDDNNNNDDNDNNDDDNNDDDNNNNDDNDNNKDVRNLLIARTVINTKGHIRKLFALQASIMDPKRSTICSPLSALLPAAKLVYGATGPSKYQLFAAVGEKDEDKLSQTIVNLLSSMRHIEGVTLDIASKIYIAKSTRMKSKFMNKILSVFETNCERIDTSDPNKAARQVNKFVEDTTHGLIKYIVKPKHFEDPISVLIVNAVYFKGSWQKRFSNIRLLPFYGHETSEVTMMSVTNTMKYFASDRLNAQIVEVPYEGGDASFVLVIPNKSNGLSEMLRTMGISDALEDAMRQTTRRSVKLTMPKFTIERKFDLIDLYRKCQIWDVFSIERSGLTDMAHDEKLYVSKAFHKATIEVTESGTTASAASALDFEWTSGMITKNEVRVVADRPFYFMIVGKTEPLFGGSFVGE